MADLKQGAEAQAVDAIKRAVERGLEDVHRAGVEALKAAEEVSESRKMPSVTDLLAGAVIAQVKDFGIDPINAPCDVWFDMETNRSGRLHVGATSRISFGKYRVLLFVLPLPE